MEQNKQANAKLSYEIAVYREQLGLLEREIERINLTAIDLLNASKTVENIKTDEILSPIGGGVFLKSKVTTSNVIVPIGAGYLKEMSKEAAAVEVTKRAEATKKALEKMNIEFEKIARKLQETGVQIRKAAGKQPDSNEQLPEGYL